MIQGMDLNSKSNSTDLRNPDVADAAGSVSNNGLEYVRSEDTVQVARQTAIHVRRRAKHQISLQRNARVSHGHPFEHTVAKDHTRVHYGDVYNTSISIMLDEKETK